MPGGQSTLGAQSMPLMHGMTHLSRGLLAGLQHPHIPSYNTSQPYQHQPSLSMHMSQGADAQPYQGLSQSGTYGHAGRPAMVMRPTPQQVQSADAVCTSIMSHPGRTLMVPSKHGKVADHECHHLTCFPAPTSKVDMCICQVCDCHCTADGR